MKFSLTTLLIFVALLAVTIGWAVDRNSQRAANDALQIKLNEVAQEVEQTTRTECVLETARDLSTTLSLDSLREVHRFSIVHEFEQVCQRAVETDGQATAESQEIASEFLVLLKWHPNTPDQLIAKLEEYHADYGGGAPLPEGVTPFLEQVLRVKAKMEEENTK